MAEPQVQSAMPLSNVQKLKLQLFHRLQRRHRDAWKRYWGSFQLYLAAKLSLEEFHSLAEELLGPDKHLHNKFVVALLSTAYQEVGDGELQRNPQLPSAPQLQDHRVEGGGAAEVHTVANGSPSSTSSKDPLLQIIKEEGARHGWYLCCSWLALRCSWLMCRVKILSSVCKTRTLYMDASDHTALLHLLTTAQRSPVGALTALVAAYGWFSF
ncbi:Transcriptional regulator of RNA polII subunit [Phytophthora infestans]|uniref:Transcriptional regulator of RNA polII subunit n=1 Tax=Phytophthora infestans TaxID=4787 RepID=A0A833TT53_PHYIN|nr:Transcriptional regulator of RNA polII subunit [Phytophthora infestans]